MPNPVSVGLFVLEGLCEIGGGYLVWSGCVRGSQLVTASRAG